MKSEVREAIEQLRWFNMNATDRPSAMVSAVIDRLEAALAEPEAKAMAYQPDASARCPYQSQHNPGFRCPHCGVVENERQGQPDEGVPAVTPEPKCLICGNREELHGAADACPIDAEFVPRFKPAPRLTEDEVRGLQARIAELESLPKEWEGSGYNPQQCGRIIKLYWEGQEKLNQIAALETELQQHSDEHTHDDSEIKRTAAGIEGIIADRLRALLAPRTAKPEGAE
jgi:hypothetical protein